MRKNILIASAIILIFPSCGRGVPVAETEARLHLQKIYDSRGLEFEHQAGVFWLRMSGVVDFLRKYGETGWRIGLCDQRPINPHDLQEDLKKNRDYVRVKDVFLYYFFLFSKEKKEGDYSWVSEHLYSAYGGRLEQRHPVRDRMIDAVLNESNFPVPWVTDK